MKQKYLLGAFLSNLIHACVISTGMFETSVKLPSAGIIPSYISTCAKFGSEQKQQQHNNNNM